MFTRWTNMPVQGLKPIRHFLLTFLILFVFWLVLNGDITAKSIIVGVIVCFLSAFVCMPLLMVPEDEERKVRYFLFNFSIPRMLLYFPWLLKEIFLSNIDVVKAAISPKLGIHPRIIRFRFDAKNPVAKSFLANSITLTPGTITLNVTDDNIYEVHALTTTAAKGLLSGNMPKKVAKIFRESVEIEIIQGVEQ